MEVFIILKTYFDGGKYQTDKIVEGYSTKPLAQKRVKELKINNKKRGHEAYYRIRKLTLDLH
jgi:hypothetical protein